jgi:hypothetical protein
MVCVQMVERATGGSQAGGGDRTPPRQINRPQRPRVRHRHHHPILVLVARSYLGVPQPTERHCMITPRHRPPRSGRTSPRSARPASRARPSTAPRAAGSLCTRPRSPFTSRPARARPWHGAALARQPSASCKLVQAQLPLYMRCIVGWRCEINELFVQKYYFMIICTIHVRSPRRQPFPERQRPFDIELMDRTILQFSHAAKW